MIIIQHLEARELYPSLIGRRVTFDGPNGSRISDELTSVVSYAADESVHIQTKNSQPLDIHGNSQFRMYGNHWSVAWSAPVEVGEYMSTENAAKSDGSERRSNAGAD